MENQRKQELHKLKEKLRHGRKLPKDKRQRLISVKEVKIVEAELVSEERIGNRELLLLKKQKEEMLIRNIKMKRLRGSLQLADKKKLERKAAKWRELTVSLSTDAKCRIFSEIQIRFEKKELRVLKVSSEVSSNLMGIKGVRD